MLSNNKLNKNNNIATNWLPNHQNKPKGVSPETCLNMYAYASITKLRPI